MTDKGFCIEYTNRLVSMRPLRTKTAMQLREIVLLQERVDIGDMFDDKGIDELFRHAAISAFVYRYVRDHQEEFC